MKAMIALLFLPLIGCTIKVEPIKPKTRVIYRTKAVHHHRKHHHGTPAPNHGSMVTPDEPTQLIERATPQPYP